MSDSPEIELGEQATIRHRFKVDYKTGTIYLSGLGYGTYMKDSFGNITKVMTSRLIKSKGNFATLEVIAEGISFDSPPDDYRLEVTELNPALEKHPRYAALPAWVRNLVNNAVGGAQVVTETEAKALLESIGDQDEDLDLFPLPTGWDSWTEMQTCAEELLLKRRIGEDTFYLPGFRITFSRYFFSPQLINPGGMIEDPITEGGLPPWTWALNQQDDSEGTIFDACDAYNPQYFDLGISWLRLCDVTDYQRTWFKYTHTWLGAPYAHWDSDIYSRVASPYPPPPIRVVS
jgi:hypothetical protein